MQQPENEELARQLRALCGQGWESGDRGDRDALLRFIYLRKDTSLLHYLIEALECEDQGLELQAIGYIGALAMEGHDFSRDNRAVIATFGGRYPDLEPFAEWVLELLEARDNA